MTLAVYHCSICVRFVPNLVNYHFYVCERLANYGVSGGEFCDHLLESINPQQRLVELDDRTKVTILLRIYDRDEDSVTIPESIQELSYDARISHMFRVSKFITIDPLPPTVATVTTRVELDSWR